MVCAVVDVAHTVTTHCLRAGDLAGARAAAEIATLAAPDEEIPLLDIVAVTEAEGHHLAADQILRHQICDRSDDADHPPAELPERTQRIIAARGWVTSDRNAS